MEEELYQIYKCLKGKRFQATYKGESDMATGNKRSVLEIDDPGMEETLATIRQQVGTKNVWKAITGPEDSPGYEYRLYVNQEDDLEEGESYLFCVTEVEVFSELSWKNPYEAGIDIHVTTVEKLWTQLEQNYIYTLYNNLRYFQRFWNNLTVLFCT